jgi:electron transport protein HydN
VFGKIAFIYICRQRKIHRLQTLRNCLSAHRLEIAAWEMIRIKNVKRGERIMNRFMIADPDKCIGCRTCEIACVLAHAPKEALAAGTVDPYFYPRLTVIKTKEVSVPVQCRHCEDAPCANVCPTGAIINENDSIQIKAEACIGCKTCLLACPFGAIELAPYIKEGKRVLLAGLKVVDENGEETKEKWIGYKCDLCTGRETGPACAGVCPTNAFIAVEGRLMAKNVRQRRRENAKELAQVKCNLFSGE